MTPIVHQIDFDGKEVQGRYVNVPGLGRLEFPMDAELHTDDLVDVRVRYVVGKVTHGANYDKQGTAKSDFVEVYDLSPVRPSFKVEAVLRPQAIEVTAATA